MKPTIFTIACLSLLSGCVAVQPPEFNYINLHKLDKELAKDDVCLVIDNEKTTFKKGHQNLSISPFLGHEGYSFMDVPKTSRDYNSDYENISCKNPIKLKREIEVSSISYPGTCHDVQYAGSVYTGATSTINPWGTISTTVNSVPHYNMTSYPCIKTSYYTFITFYRGKDVVGGINNEYWSSDGDIDYTISYFTDNFISKISEDYEDAEQKKYCTACYKKCKSMWCKMKCNFHGCNPDEDQ